MKMRSKTSSKISTTARETRIVPSKTPTANLD